MISNNKSLHQLGRFAAAILCHWAITFSAFGQEPNSVEWALDDQTMAVGWINPATADFESIRQLADSVGLNTEDVELKIAQSAILDLRDATASRIYVIADFSSILGQYPMGLIPAKDPAAVTKVLKALIPAQSGIEIATQGSTVMIGRKERIERLKGAERGNPTARLIETLSAAKGDHGFAVAIPSVPRGMLCSLLKSQPSENEAGQKAARVISGMESGRFTINEKEKRYETIVDFSNAETATFFATLARDSIAADSKVPDKMRPTVANNSVTWRVEGIDSMKQLLQSMPLIRKAREDAEALQVMNKLKQVGLAFHNFESAYRTFVPQAIVSKEGKKLLSWRVMILPYIEESALYEQFHLDEPWDSEHNTKLVDKIPKLYATVGAGKGKTSIQTPLSPNSAFGRLGKPIQFADITDGTSNTIWLVEVDPSDAVIWTKPDDYLATSEESFQKLLSNRTKVPFGFIDGSVRTFDRKMTFELFQQLLSINGGEIVQLP